MLRRHPLVPAALFLLALLVARAAYLIWWCPYTLVEDEAHYWEWSRRLALSYYTKGPGIAWTIGASTHLLGVSEWAVRLPAALSSAIAAFALAALARDASDDRRAPMFAALLFTLAPIHLALALLMTIDGPYVACWSVAAWAAHRAAALGRPRYWTLVGVGVGVGFLNKYTMLLILPGVLLAGVLAWRAERAALRRHLGWLAVALVVFLVCISPVLWWNHGEGWPTIRHLFRHLDASGAGGGGSTARAWSPMWPVVFVGSQVGAIGPTIAILGLAVIRAWRERGGARWASRRFMILASAPVLLFYGVISCVTEPEANWPLAGYATLFALAATMLPGELDRYRALLASWRRSQDRPRQGLLRRAPETAWQVSWHWSLGVGVVVALGLVRVDLLARLPWIGPLVPTYRLMGADTRAAEALEMLSTIRKAGGGEPLIVSELYGPASQMAFYLPGRPVTLCARSALGGERSQYDYFPDTDLRNGALEGRNALLIGASAERWSALFDRVEPLGSLDPEFDRARIARGKPARRQTFAGYGYHPPRSNNP